MARWKYCSRAIVLAIVMLSPSVCSRPSSEIADETISVSTTSISTVSNTELPTEDPNRIATSTSTEQQLVISSSETNPSDGSRDVKSKTPAIGESIKLVANQLLQSSSNITPAEAIVEDVRIPPKLKNQVDKQKHKIKTRQENNEEKIENSHAGIAVPVTMEELETENKISEITSESSTSSEGISTWILLSNSPNKDNDTVPTEATKAEEVPKKPKPNSQKTKTKRPQQNKTKRPIIASINKSDLIAGGSAINENVLNKIKDTVLSNVQKNSNVNRITALSTSTVIPSTAVISNKQEVTTIIPNTLSTKDTTKVIKKKNKNRQKVTSTSPSTIDSSALLPMEPKEQEIELEISTPATTTKKPRRSSTRNKSKTKKRKTAKPTTQKVSENVETKNSNKTKVSKPAKKPSPITTQIYNYLSREVMPSVGVGIVGLAGLVGLASYFFYPFAAPVRRTFEVDKKDDLYKHNAEEYANDGNGQPEEEMLGTVLAGMPSHAKQKLNPYVNQSPYRYHVKKEPEQNIRYRHVANSYDSSHNSHYPQQKTGIAHGATYSEVDPIKYNTQYETRHVYRPEASQYPYNNDNTNSYTPYPAVEPIYAAPQTGPSGITSYGSDTGNTAYGAQQTQDTNFKPVYPYEGQVFSETTSNPLTYPSTSLYLGSNTETTQHQKFNYAENTSDEVDNKFVVGNIPKELVDSVTPAVVPEHGPRKLNRKKRNITRNERSITGSIEETLKDNKDKNVFISNDIDVSVAGIKKYEKSVIAATTSKAITNLELASKSKEKEVKNEKTSPENINNDIPVYTVYAKPSEVDKVQKTSSEPEESTVKPKREIIESVSTLPLETHQATKYTTDIEITNEIDTTTKSFRIYEVFRSSTQATDLTNTYMDSKNKNDATSVIAESTTQYRNANTETTTDSKTEFTSTFVPSIADIKETGRPIDEASTTKTPKPGYLPEVITYPPYNQEGGFFTFLKRLIDFKYRLGLSILQTTSDSLNRYLRNMSHTVKDVMKATQNRN